MKIIIINALFVMLGWVVELEKKEVKIRVFLKNVHITMVLTLIYYIIGSSNLC